MMTNYYCKMKDTITVHARKKLVHEHQFAHAALSAQVIALDYVELHVIQDFYIQNAKFLVTEAFQISYLGQNTMKRKGKCDSH